MTPERYRQLKHLLQQALDRQGEERGRFVADVCADDAGLRQELESLILHHESASSFLETEHSGEPDPVPGGGSEPLPRLEAQSVVMQLGERGGVRLSELVDEPRLPEIASGADKYELLELIGEGGMGRVYLAYERDLKRSVAVKMLREGSGRLVARFLEEAQVMGQLQHPGIVTVLELGVAAGDRLYYTMPLVRGLSLQQLLEGLRAGDPRLVGRYSLTRLVQLFMQVVQAVSYAHDKRVVHRDLKPGNVMVGEHGEVQVLDWGLAKVLGEGGVRTDSGGQLTQRDIVLGTPAYMAPEQALGTEVDARSDIYALGVLLYELLTLTPPFRGAKMEVLIAQISDEPQPLRARAPERSIPPELEQICLRALRKTPAERYQHAEQLEQALQQWIEAEAEHVRRRQLAEERAGEAALQMQRYQRKQAQLAELEQQSERLASTLEPWQPEAEKRPLFELRDRIEATRDELVRVSSRLVSTLTSAVGFDPANRRARELYADYYWSRFQEAERVSDTRTCEFYGELVERYHDGKYALELEGDGALSLTSSPPGASVYLERLEREHCRLVPGRRRTLGRTPIRDLELPMGSYLVTLRLEGCRDTRYPVHISRNRHWQGEVRLLSEQELGSEFVYVPAGPFLEGGKAVRQRPRPLEERWQEGFLLARYHVTVSEYLEFLDALTASQGLEAAKRRAPRPSRASEPYLAVADGRLVLPAEDRDGTVWDPRWPVVGVSWLDAHAYCEWRSARDGRAYRLPTSVEWEKAARGVDGRAYPWGPEFDASLANSRQSRKGVSGPLPVDAYPSDVSIYGVRGMAGNAIDWTDGSELDLRRTDTLAPELDSGDGPIPTMRGGGWGAKSWTARSDNRACFHPENLFPDVGFRLARDLPEPE